MCVVAIPTGVISAGFVEYDNRIRVEMILRSDKDGLVNREVIAVLNKNARRKRMNVNEYLLFLMMQDAQKAVEEDIPAEKAAEKVAAKAPVRKVQSKKRKK